MSEKILNQDEIDALLKGVDTGAVKTEPKEPQVPATITPVTTGSSAAGWPPWISFTNGSSNS
jgi:flagellar motor switch protein FliM